MTFFIYIFICLGFIVIQTTLFPLFAWLTDFYDLLIPFVVYLGLFRPLKEGLPVVFFLGLTMDTLSGGAFGIYSTTYFWLYACIAWLIGILHFKNNLLLPFIVVVGVLMENLVFLGTIMLGKTTISESLAIRACLYGLRVLCIDVDQQANLTKGLGMADACKIQ